MQEEVKISNIFWKRTYLFIEYESKKEQVISLALLKKNVEIDRTTKEEKVSYEILNEHILETKQLEENKYRCKINITIAEGRSILEDGNWKIIINHNPLTRPTVSDEVMLAIEDYSRVFRYGQNFYAYVVTFNIDKLLIDGEEKISIGFFANYMRTNRRPFKHNYIDAFIETKKFKKRLRKIFFVTAKGMLNLYYQVISHLTPKRQKRILIMSENRVKIMDNLEAIDNRLKERGLDKEFKISYSFRNIFDGKLQNPFKWLAVVTKVARNGYIFVDDYVPLFAFLKLHKKTTLVQVWHAGFGFKLVGYGRFGIKGSPRPRTSSHRQYTYGLIGNENLKEIYSEVWGIEKEALLPTGMPRLEHFLDKDNMDKKVEEFYQSYPQLKGKTIITFAPTYRGSSQTEAYYDYDKIDFDKLYRYCKETNSAVAFGKHHFIKQEIPIKEEHKDLIFDMSHYKLNDLFYVTDILITDYSSCFYDFLLLNRPVLFFVYDKAYYSATRGVHRPIEKVAPGKVCETFEQLLQALYEKDYGEKEKKDFLVDNCVSNKKLASDQVIDYILLGKKDSI